MHLPEYCAQKGVYNVMVVRCLSSIKYRALALSFTFALAVVFLFIPFARAEAAKNVCPFNWTQNLRMGSAGADVLKLQQFLNASADTIIAPSGTGSIGNESVLYGQLTKRAVIKFQEKYASEILSPNGLTKGTGAVGASTRAKLNALCRVDEPLQGATSPAAVTQTASAATATISDGLTVSDPGQTEISIAPASATVLFLSFDLVAGSKDVLVKEIEIERTGLGIDAAFGSFGLYDEEGLQIGNIVSLNSNHRAVFRTPFNIRAGKKKSYEIYANMQTDESSYDSQTPAIQLLGIKASSPVEGVLPLRGPMHKINSTLTVGGAKATLSQYDPAGAVTRYINDKDVRFSGIRITTNSPEDITLSYIIWTQSGSVGVGDIANVSTVANGVSYPATLSPYSNKEYVSFFEPGIVIKKGNSVDVYVQGDLTGTGAGRTIEFDIRDINDEVSLSGNQYGLAVWLSPSGNTDVSGAHSAFITSDGTTSGNTGIPFFAGSITTINGGTLNYIGRN